MTTKRRVAGVLSTLTILTYFLRLDHGPLEEWDEAIYADAARNVLDGHVLILHISGRGHNLGTGPFLEKPPLVPWMQAVSMLFAGENPVGARLPSLLAFVGCVILVVYIASELVSLRAGLVSGLLLIFSDAATGTHGPLYGSTDVVLTLFGSLLVWMWIQHQRTSPESWRLYVAAVALAAAVLTKGVAAAVFVLVAIPALFWRVDTLRSREFWTASAAFILIALPWYIYAYVAVGDAFVNQFFVEQVVKRSTGEFGVEPGGILPWMRYPYFVRGPQYMGLGLTGIVAAGVISAAVDSVSKKKLTAHPMVLYLLFWGALFPVFYAFAGGNHLWYIFPTVVPLSVLGGWSIETLIERY